ncbi:HNH endonuclease signature motif containing protein [Nocardioides sambongensis]|uniref:HNH endonuclease signature motif containing protein n=1 Tax=Nocardioides sambongensis TaxID=2589074 RepID=UPI0015E82CA1|nr:HNH endonuclease signature motif containing protein [Nocardioides sambongensis]
MSTATLDATVLPLPSPGSRAAVVLERAGEAVGEVADLPVEVLDERGLTDAVTTVARLRSQLQAVELALAAEAEQRRVAADAGDTGADAWLSRLTGERREQLRGGLRLARLLRERYRATARALGAGEIRLEQARVIVEGLEVSADDVPETLRVQAEELMIAKATGAATRTGVPMPPTGLRRAVRRVYGRLDADIAAMHLRRSVRRNHQRGVTKTWFTLHDNGDGTCAGRFCVPELHGQVLRTVLETLSAPRRFGRDGTGTPLVDASAGTETSGLGWCDKLGRAFCELLEHLPTDRLPRSVFTLMATIDLDSLRSGLNAAGVGTSTTGADLDAGEVRRLACEAGIVPAVLGGASVPLDLGRTRRLHTEKQRQALGLVHDSCAIASCDRPFAWTEIHHTHAWSAGGATDLANAVPLCWAHHRAVHDGRFDLIRHSASEWVLHRRRRC